MYTHIYINQMVFTVQAVACMLFKGSRLLKGKKALRAANIKHISVSIGCNGLEIQSRHCILRLYLI